MPTPIESAAEVVQQGLAIWQAWGVNTDQLNEWARGSVTGGPSGDGYYPLTNRSGDVRLIPCPLKMQTQIAGQFGGLFDQMRAWLGGTPNGGPFGNGQYPITLSTGAVINVPCPMKMAQSAIDVQSIVGSGSLIALTEGRVYATRAAMVAAGGTIDGKWALVHSDTDLGLNGYYLAEGGAWVIKVSLASEALLIALGANLRGPVVTQIIGRPIDPSNVGATVTNSQMFVWADPAAGDTIITGLRLFAAAPGTLRLCRYTKDGGNITKQATALVTIPIAGLQTVAVDFPIGNGEHVSLTGAGVFTSTQAAADGQGWWQVNADVDVRPVGDPTTNLRLEVQFQLSRIEQTVNAQAFGDVVAHVTDLLTRTSSLEAQAALMFGSVVQQVGMTGTPENGAGASDLMFIWADPVERDGMVELLKFHARDTGVVKLARYSRDGTTVTRQAMVDITVASTGDKALTAAHFGDFPVKAGDHVAVAGEGIITSKNEPADGAGWWQVNAQVPVRTIGAAVTSPRLQVGFSIRQPIQFVTAERLKVIEDQGADHHQRLAIAEPKLDLLSSAVVQLVGRKEAPIDGSPVSNAMFIWNAPMNHPSYLSLITVFVEATGPFTLVRWRRTGNNMSRRDVRTFLATSTGLQNFTPADFGGPLWLDQGEYIGLAADGLFGSTSGATDDGGWWNVVNGLDERTIGAPVTSNRLEVQFRFDQFPQVVTADAYNALKQQVEELASSGVGSDLPGGGLVKATDWFNDVEAEAHKAPLMGGRPGQRMLRSVGKRTLAHIAKVADVQGGGTITAISDDAATDAVYSTTALKVVTAPLTQVMLAPAVANTVLTDVRGGIIRWMFKPLANMFSGIDRFSIELHSAGTPAAPTANYHRLDPTGAPSDLRQRLTSQNGVGRWQCYSIAVKRFSAFGAGADLSAIKFARVVLRTKAGESMSLYCGGVDFVPSLLTKAKCIISFDDGRLPQMSYVAPLMAKYGFPGVLFPSPVAMSTDVSASYLTSQQIRNLHDHLGWQIGSQAWTTEDRTIVDGWTENQFTAELGKLRAWHGAMGLTGGEHGSYFSGVGMNDMIAYPSFRKHYRSMRSYYGGNSSGSPLAVGETFPWGDPMSIRAYAPELLDTAANGAQCVAHFQQAIDDGQIAYFGYHDPTLSTNIRAGFETLLAGLDANRGAIDVVTEDDLVAA